MAGAPLAPSALIKDEEEEKQCKLWKDQNGGMLWVLDDRPEFMKIDQKLRFRPLSETSREEQHVNYVRFCFPFSARCYIEKTEHRGRRSSQGTRHHTRMMHQNLVRF